MVRKPRTFFDTGDDGFGALSAVLGVRGLVAVRETAGFCAEMGLSRATYDPESSTTLGNLTLGGVLGR